ncbi:MAG: hypothetical protein AAGD96_21285, partial [Chloroflexota bacterium]
FNHLSTVFNNFVNYRPIVDDFSDPNSGWPIYNDPSIVYGYAGGEYYILNKSDRFLGLTVIGQPAKNYTLSVQGRKASKDIEGGYGILLDVNDDFSYFRGFVAFTDFDIVWHIDVGSDGRLRVIESKQVSSLEPNGSYTFSVERFDAGSVQVSVPNSNFSYLSNSGKHRVGFVTVPLANNFEARFDNFSLLLIDEN